MPRPARSAAARRPPAGLFVAVAVVLVVTGSACNGEEAPSPVYPATEPHQSGVQLPGGLVTTATGENCAECHADVIEAYRSSGMYESLTLPTGEGSVEARMVGREHVDPETGITIRFDLDDGRYVQRIVYRDPEGVERSTYDMHVDLVVGSGHAARTYFQIKDGYVFELPLTWYSELDDIALSPGKLFQTTALREVTHLCVTCHTGAIEPRDARVETGFRGEVSLGVGCDRCHGESQEHVETGDPRTVVNPARLSDELQSDLCNQCHFSDAAELVKPRASHAAYRPGDPLGTVYGVFAAQGAESNVGTSIAGHAKRMRQSRCYTESGRMTCTTCHNPHRGHKDTTTIQDTAGGCYICHQPESCGEAHGRREGRECWECHMASVPSSDIAHTRTTDHFIQLRPPPPAERGSPEKWSIGSHALRDLRLVNTLDPKDELPGSRLLKAEAYLHGHDMARTIFGKETPGYVTRAERILDEMLEEDPDNVDALVRKAYVLRRRGRDAEAIVLLDRLLAQEDDHPQAIAERAFCEQNLGNAADAARWLRRALDVDPYNFVVLRRLADALGAAGRHEEALEVLEDTRRRFGPRMALAQAGMEAGWAAGNLERALVFAYDQLAFTPRDPMALTAAAELCRRAGLPPDRARGLAKAALEHDDAYLPALISLAETELDAGNRREADQYALRASNAAPESPEVKRLLQRLR